MLFTQNSIDKKKYGREDIINALEREGLGRIAHNLRNNRDIVDAGKTK